MNYYRKNIPNLKYNNFNNYFKLKYSHIFPPNIYFKLKYLYIPLFNNYLFTKGFEKMTKLVFLNIVYFN